MSRWPARRPFEDARTFVRSLGLHNQAEWNEWAKSPSKPADIPSNPHIVYKQEYQGLGNWLGTGNVSNRNKSFLPFVEAREIVHLLELPSAKAWYEYSTYGNRPENIPSAPDIFYGDEFQGWGDWLGTGSIATQEVEFLPFWEAREHVHKLQLRGVKAWERYCQSGDKPPDIPSSPRVAYPNGFVDWYDWLGTKKRPKRQVQTYEHLHLGIVKEIS
jgi:hypothetical protein